MAITVRFRDALDPLALLSGLDHHALDPALQPGPGPGRRHHLRPGGDRPGRCGLDGQGPHGGLQEIPAREPGHPGRGEGFCPGGAQVPAPLPLRRFREDPRSAGRLLRGQPPQARASCTWPPHSARTTINLCTSQGIEIFDPVDHQGKFTEGRPGPHRHGRIRIQQGGGPQAARGRVPVRPGELPPQVSPLLGAATSRSSTGPSPAGT